MRQTFSVSFFLKKNYGKIHEPQPIILRITINGKSSVISTKVKCPFLNWNQKCQRIEGDSKNYKSMNEALGNMKLKINQIYYQQTLYGDDTTAEIVKDIYTGLSQKKHNLISFFEIHNKRIYKQIGISRSKATYQKYDVTLRHLVMFLKEERFLEDIPLYEINHYFLVGFEAYLRTSGKCGHNTAAKFMQFFKRIILLALNSGYIKQNPFQEYKIKLEKVNRETLTENELKRIIRKKITIKRLELIKDLFVFACFTNLEDKKQRKANHGNELIVRNERPLLTLSV